MIREAAERALRAPEPPVQPTGPFTYDVMFDAAQAVTATTAVPCVEQTGERRVSFTLPTMVEAIRCFKVVSTLAAGSTERSYG